MSLIARFVFDKGDPVDVRINPDLKDKFVKKVTLGEAFQDEDGEGAFWANLDQVKFFFVFKEPAAIPSESKSNSEEEKEQEGFVQADISKM